MAEERVCDHDRHAEREDVHRDAGDDLLAAMGDAGKAVNERQHDGGGERGGQPRPGRAGERGDRGGGESPGQQLALQPDIDDAGALGHQPGHGAEDERRGEAGRAVEDRKNVDPELRHGRRSARAAAAPARA